MKVFWFDTETSGLDPQKNGIISLAYAVEIDGEIVEEGLLYSNCRGKEISPRALEVNGFRFADVHVFPDPRRMYDALKSVFENYVDRFDRGDRFIAGGYNVGFDMGFLRQLWSESGDKYFYSYFGYAFVDPSQIFRFLQYAGAIEGGSAGKLSELAHLMGVEGHEKAHDALIDVRMTIEVTRRLKRFLAPHRDPQQPELIA